MYQARPQNQEGSLLLVEWKREIFRCFEFQPWGSAYVRLGDWVSVLEITLLEHVALSLRLKEVGEGQQYTDNYHIKINRPILTVSWE